MNDLERQALKNELKREIWVELGKELSDHFVARADVDAYIKVVEDAVQEMTGPEGKYNTPSDAIDDHEARLLLIEGVLSFWDAFEKVNNIKNLQEKMKYASHWMRLGEMLDQTRTQLRERFIQRMRKTEAHAPSDASAEDRLQVRGLLSWLVWPPVETK